jgi:hypothetical protein
MLRFAALARAQRAVVGGVAAVLIVVLTATSAGAAGPGRYGIVGSPDGHYMTLSQRNLVTGVDDTDDSYFFLSTSGTGAHRLPFRIGLYNQWYRDIVISTNGNIVLGVTSADALNDRDPNPGCLYSVQKPFPAVFPFWDDLVFTPGDTSLGFPQGVFVRTTGRAPHRVFTVAWQGARFQQPDVTTPPVPVEAEAIFREGTQKVVFVYGTAGGDAATIGVQSPPQFNRWTQYACNSGDPETVTNGRQLAFVHVN